MVLHYTQVQTLETLQTMPNTWAVHVKTCRPAHVTPSIYDKVLYKTFTARKNKGTGDGTHTGR